jgi:hypothetical protein
MAPQDIAEFLTSSWVLAAGEGVKMPTGSGVLDRAVKATVENGTMPAGLQDSFRFVETPSGLASPELRDALTWALASDLTSDPNPRYIFTVVRFRELIARHFLSNLDIDEEEARNWGLALIEALEQEKNFILEQQD